MLLFMMLVNAVYTYLLVALPQSSSTAAMQQLGALSGRPVSQRFPCCAEQPCHTPDGTVSEAGRRPSLPSLKEQDPIHALAVQHSDMCELPRDTLSRWINGTTIYKQHVAPTVQNLGNVKIGLETSQSSGLVVLTREPRASLHARCERYRRERGFKLAFAWMRDHGLQHFNGLKAWNAQWAEFASAMPSRIKVVRYEQMRSSADRKQTLLAVLRFWHLPALPSMFDNSLMSAAHYVNRSDPICMFANSLSAMRRVSRKATWEQGPWLKW